MESLDVIAVPILVGGENLVRHFQTIDVPLKRYFILDNSMGEDESTKEAFRYIHDNMPDHIEELVICSTYQNTGFPGAVNWIIKQNTDCNHWIISGFDWWPKPGEWEKVLNKKHLLPFGAFLGTGNDQFCGMLLTPDLLKRVGYFDENFHPGYFEDNDYRYRLKITNTRMESLPLANEHKTSSTLNSSEFFKEKNKYTFQKNFEYYVDKWGGPPGREVYVTPFNKNFPVDYWQYNPARAHRHSWI